MFGLFKSKKRRDQEKRIIFLYQDCINEINEFINKCHEPTKDDVFKISINAKITYDLFCNVKEIQPAAREILHPLVTNGLTVLIEFDGLDKHAALEKMQSMVRLVFRQLAELNKSDATLPAVDRAFIMSKLVDFY